MPLRMPPIGSTPAPAEQQMSDEARMLTDRLQRLEANSARNAAAAAAGQMPLPSSSAAGGDVAPMVSFGQTRGVGFTMPVLGGDAANMVAPLTDHDTSSAVAMGRSLSRGRPSRRGGGSGGSGQLRMPPRTDRSMEGEAKADEGTTARPSGFGPAAAMLKHNAAERAHGRRVHVTAKGDGEEGGERQVLKMARAAALPDASMSDDGAPLPAVQPAGFSFKRPAAPPPPAPPVWPTASGASVRVQRPTFSFAVAQSDVHMDEAQPAHEHRAPMAYRSPMWRDGARKLSTSSGASPATDPNINKILHGKLVELSANEDVLYEQRNPRSPLCAAKSFEELHLPPELLKVIYQMGWMRPSRIQETVVPLLLLDPPLSVVAQAQSGTGKTAAFIICMLKRIDPALNMPQALCVAPTFELAKQIYEVVQRMAQKIGGLRVRCVVRQDGTRAGVGRPPPVTEHIVIGTPGKTIDFVSKFRAIDVSNIRVLVLDEADVMLSTHGHLECTKRLVKAIETSQAGNGMKLQIAMFSATYDTDVFDFARQLIPNPDDRTEVCLRRSELPLENVLQFFVDCIDRDTKFDTICALYSSLTIGSSIIFCHTRASADWLANKMTERRHKVAVLHGQMSMDMRYSVIKEFIAANAKVLITTNLCSRGIDVPQCSVVINYDLPVLVDNAGVHEAGARATVTGPDFDTYIHRIGRTGRFGKKGLAVNLICGQTDHEYLHEIAEHFAHPVELLNPHDKEAMERVDESRRVTVPHSSPMH